MRVMKNVVSAAALAVVVASCGGDDTDTADTIAVSSEKGGGADLLEAMAAAQEEAGSYEFTMDMGIEGQSVTGSGAATYGSEISDVNMTMTLDVGGSEMTMLMVEGQTYMNLPSEAEMPADVSWITIDPDGDDVLSQQFGAMMEEFGSNADIQEQFLEQADLITVTEVGPATVEGVDTTEYEMVVDVDDLDEFLDLPDDEEVPFDELSYSLWVDEDYLPRQLSSDLGGVGDMEMQFANFGAEVEVEAPAADDVTDFGTLMEELMGELEKMAELEGLTEEEMAELMEQFQSSLTG